MIVPAGGGCHRVRCHLADEGTAEQQFARKRGIKPVVARQSIGARTPTRAERRHLQITGSKPVLTVTQIVFDAAGKAVEIGDPPYRASDHSVDLMVDEH